VCACVQWLIGAFVALRRFFFYLLVSDFFVLFNGISGGASLWVISSREKGIWGRGVVPETILLEIVRAVCNPLDCFRDDAHTHTERTQSSFLTASSFVSAAHNDFPDRCSFSDPNTSPTLHLLFYLRQKHESSSLQPHRSRSTDFVETRTYQASVHCNVCLSHLISHTHTLSHTTPPLLLSFRLLSWSRLPSDTQRQ